MLDVHEVDRITTHSNSESKMSNSSHGSGLFWKPMNYLTSGSEGGSSNPGSRRHPLQPRRRASNTGRQREAWRSIGQSGSEADSLDERSFFKPSREGVSHIVFGDSSASGSSQGAPRIQSHAARIRKREQDHSQTNVSGNFLQPGQDMQTPQGQMTMPSQTYVQPIAGIAAGSLPNGFIQQGVAGMEGNFLQPGQDMQKPHGQMAMPSQTYVQPIAGIAAGSLPNGFIQQGVAGMEGGCFFAIQQTPPAMPSQTYVQPIAGIAAGSLPNGFIQQGVAGMEGGCFFAIQQTPPSAPTRGVEKPVEAAEPPAEPMHPSAEPAACPKNDRSRAEAPATPTAKSQPSANLRLAQPLPVGQQDPSKTKGSTVEELLAQVPTNEEGERTSLGSLQHPDTCSPCLFWFKGKCGKGVHCDYCHFRHPGQKNKRIRPSKHTRLQMRAATQDDDEEDENNEKFNEAS
eukprot:symbB.v1.2.029869.t1/scaffold3241.1/size60449/4